MSIPTKAEVRKNPNILFDHAPASPIGQRAVEISVFAKRCVYLNNYRIAGGKPYASESLPSHTLATSLKEVINAFPEADIRAALEEAEARREYFRDYHAQAEDARP